MTVTKVLFWAAVIIVALILLGQLYSWWTSDSSADSADSGPSMGIMHSFEQKLEDLGPDGRDNLRDNINRVAWRVIIALFIILVIGGSFFHWLGEKLKNRGKKKLKKA